MPSCGCRASAYCAKISKMMFSMLQSLWRPASIWNDSSYFLDSVEQLSHTESLYSSEGRTYEIHIFCLKYSADAFKSLHETEPCPCFSASAIYAVCLTTVIRKNKTNLSVYDL